jgi:Protein of unknown function (DUF3261)
MTRGLGFLLCLAVACAAQSPTSRTAPPTCDYPTQLSSPSSWPRNFLWRQHLVATYRGQTNAFDAVLQKRGDELLLIGLTPFGTKAFVMRQVALEVRVTSSSVPIELPFPPRYVFNDISRAYLQEAGTAPSSDGTHFVERNGERIQETWRDGRLLERRFRREGGGCPGDIVVTYVGGMVNGRSPALIEFDNGWLGYHLSIATLSEQDL